MSVSELNVIFTMDKNLLTPANIWLLSSHVHFFSFFRRGSTTCVQFKDAYTFPYV